jgi:AraC family transcriptional regulator of adaptative response / DNA-3-methyladenine glycosylase II
LAQLRQLFDTECDPQAIARVLGELASADPGLRLPGAVDPFEIVVRAILGQQITVAAARTLATRFVALFGETLAAPSAPSASSLSTLPGAAPDLTHLFPRASAVAILDAAQLGEIGIIRTRGQAIIDVARALTAGSLRLERPPGGTPQSATAQSATDGAVQATLAALTSIRGIGPWTAHYVAMRSLGWTDAFPPGDVVACKALQAATPAAASALAERWRPWRAYALLHLWRKAAADGR